MKQYYVIDTPEKMKAVSDPLRIRLMMILWHEEATEISFEPTLRHKKEALGSVHLAL